MKTAESIGNGGDNKLTSKGGFTAMKKLLFIGLAILLALTIGAGAAFAGENPPKPNLLVTKIVNLVAVGVNSTVNSMNNITNIGAVNTTVTKVTDTLYCQSGDGWEEIGQETDETERVLEAGELLEVNNLFTFDLPVEAQILKNVIEVEAEINGRQKVFQAVMTMNFETEEPDGEEPEGEPVGNKVQSQWQAGKSHSWHFNYANGASGRLNCQIDGDGNLKGVFNGTGLDPEVERYCLSYGEVPLGYGTPNKAGKVHIKAEGPGIIDWEVEDPDVANLSLDPC